MKIYIGCEQVKARAMTRGEYNKIRGWTVPVDENPNDEGYVIKRFVDGKVHINWFPKNEFEKTYVKMGVEPLRDTAILMCSEDYKERFIAEYQQLVIRYKGLKAMLEKWDENELNFTPTCPRNTYNMQIEAMVNYISVLEARAVMENINLQEF